jgi:hypothetical protein
VILPPQRPAVFLPVFGGIVVFYDAAAEIVKAIFYLNSVR